MTTVFKLVALTWSDNFLVYSGKRLHYFHLHQKIYSREFLLPLGTVLHLQNNKPVSAIYLPPQWSNTRSNKLMYNVFKKHPRHPTMISNCVPRSVVTVEATLHVAFYLSSRVLATVSAATSRTGKVSYHRLRQSTRVKR